MFFFYYISDKIVKLLLFRFFSLNIEILNLIISFVVFYPIHTCGVFLVFMTFYQYMQFKIPNVGEMVGKKKKIGLRDNNY